MQFALICRDAPDALDLRMYSRPAHIEGLKREKAIGTIRDGGAILNVNGEMEGSIVFCEFPGRAALDEYLSREVYSRDGVWGKIEVLEMKFVDWDTVMGAHPSGMF